MDEAVTRRLLQALTTPPQRGKTPVSDLVPSAQHDNAFQWLIREGLGPLASVMLADIPVTYRARLQADLYSALAENQIHKQNLDQIQSALATHQVAAVLMKGAALAETVYPEPALRTMSDLDFWIRAADMPVAMQVMQDLGFQTAGKSTRPLALQALAGGEIQYYRPDWQMGMVELHFQSLAGWWLTRVARIDHEGMWRRKHALNSVGETLYQLEPEDFILQLGVHLGLNHRFSMAAIRGLVDIALVADRYEVNWQTVIDRAISWRIKTIMFLVLDLVDKLIGLPQRDRVLSALRPPSYQLRILRRYVSPQMIIKGHDWRTNWQRFALWLSLVDQPQDALTLIGRTVWPEPAWLEARYGRPTGNFYHMWQLMRHRQL